MWPLRDPDLRRIWRQHPYRNLQAPAGSINNGHRPIAPLRPADNLKSNAVERVEGIKDLNVRALRAQGIVGGGVIIRMSTAPFRSVVYLQATAIGYVHAIRSFCQ